MGWKDRLGLGKKKQSAPQKLEERSFLVNGIDLIVRKSPSYADIAELSIIGGSEDQRDALSSMVLSMIKPSYDYNLRTGTPDDHTTNLLFGTPGMQSLDGRPQQSSSKPLLTFEALCNATQRVEQRAATKQIE